MQIVYVLMCPDCVAVVLQVTCSGSGGDWQYNTCGVAIAKCICANSCMRVAGDLQWQLYDMLRNRNEWWVPGKLVELRQRLEPYRKVSWRMSCLIC